MTQEQKDKIVRISKEFVSGFEPDIPLAGSGWLIVDPLSGYLNSIGFRNTLSQYEACDKHPQILIMEFEDGSILIPAGGDFKQVLFDATNYMWVSK